MLSLVNALTKLSLETMLPPLCNDRSALGVVACRDIDVRIDGDSRAWARGGELLKKSPVSARASPSLVLRDSCLGPLLSNKSAMAASPSSSPGDEGTRTAASAGGTLSGELGRGGGGERGAEGAGSYLKSMVVWAQRLLTTTTTHAPSMQLGDKRFVLDPRRTCCCKGREGGVHGEPSMLDQVGAHHKPRAVEPC